MVVPAPVRHKVTPTRVVALERGGSSERPDNLVTEEPMEIRVGWPGREPEAVSVTMRTPGNDFELAAGFLLAEGVVATRTDVAGVRYCVVEGEPQLHNVVSVDLTRPVDLDGMLRGQLVGSSCGICGTASLEMLQDRCPTVAPGSPISAEILVTLPERLRESQPVFERTGGLHAGGLFSFDGQALAVREDIGRHNAVDKLAGWALLSGALPLRDVALVVSGRLSYEIVQKAAVAGVGVLVAVSAPSSLAVETAQRFNITLAAFVRDGRANLYSHPERVRQGSSIQA